MFFNPFGKVFPVINGWWVRNLRKNRDKGTPFATDERGQNAKASHLGVGKADLGCPVLEGQIVCGLAGAITQGYNVRLDFLD